MSSLERREVLWLEGLEDEEKEEGGRRVEKDGLGGIFLLLVEAGRIPTRNESESDLIMEKKIIQIPKNDFVKKISV